MLNSNEYLKMHPVFRTRDRYCHIARIITEENIRHEDNDEILCSLVAEER